MVELGNQTYFYHLARQIGKIEAAMVYILEGLNQWSTQGRNIRPKPKFFTIRPSALAAKILF